MNVGDTVRLKKGITVGKIPEGRQNFRTAVIQSFLEGIPGGVRVSRDLGGMLFWNVSDLVRYRKNA